MPRALARRIMSTSVRTNGTLTFGPLTDYLCVYIQVCVSVYTYVQIHTTSYHNPNVVYGP